MVLLAHDDERTLLLTSLDELRYWGSFLSKPLDRQSLAELLGKLPTRDPALTAGPRDRISPVVPGRRS